MVLSMLALCLQLAASPSTVEDVYGAKVPLENAKLLLVASADRETLREKLAVVRKRRDDGDAGHALVVIVDLSDVSTLFRGVAKGKIKDRAVEAQKQNPTLPAPRFVADLDGSLSRALRGPHRGSCLVRTNARGEYLSGSTIDDLVKRPEASSP
jgi:hypothetical protein